MDRAAAFLSILLAACLLTIACREGENVDLGAVPVHVVRVAVDVQTQSPVVILEEDAGARRLPIWIGVSEASSIANELDATKPPRPNTHDLAKRLIDGLEGEVARVVVTHLSDGVYYARIVLARGDERVEIDSRPSDAIAIALRYHAPLFVHESLFVQALEASAAGTGQEI